MVRFTVMSGDSELMVGGIGSFPALTSTVRCLVISQLIAAALGNTCAYEYLQPLGMDFGK